MLDFPSSTLSGTMQDLLLRCLVFLHRTVVEMLQSTIFLTCMLKTHSTVNLQYSHLVSSSGQT